MNGIPNSAKQLAVVPTSFHGKLINCYLEISADDKKDLKTFQLPLQEKTRLTKNTFMATKHFQECAQGPWEKASDFSSELKKLFYQAFPYKDINSAVVLQHLLTGYC